MSVFLNTEGRLRSDWRVALCAACFLGALYGVIWGAAALFGLLFDAWGLTTSNLPYAAAWARWIVTWHSVFVYGAAYLASCAAGTLAAGRWLPARTHGKGNWLPGALIGGGTAVLLTVIVLVSDCMRLEYPLAEPHFYPAQLSTLALIVLGKLSTEVLTKRILFDGVRRRGLAYALASAAFAILSVSRLTPTAVINALLLGLVGCVLYERGGLWNSVAFQSVWTLWTNVIFAWPEAGTNGVYGLYEVSEDWLTGGSSASGGILLSVGLVGILAVMFRNELSCFLKRRREK